MLDIYKPCTGATSAVTDSFQAYLTEGAHFTETEEYPILRPDMITTELPVKIMPFHKAITFQGDLSDTFICSYSPDQTFERIRRQPAKYLKFFKRTAGLIGFDFSIHTDMPIIKQKAQIYDNLALTYYFGNNGIPIIPNLRCGVDELLPEFLSAIPHHSKIAVGTHGFIKETREKLEWYYFLDQAISKLEPTDVIVYGTLRGKLFDEFKSRTNIVTYNAWIADRWKEVLGHVD